MTVAELKERMSTAELSAWLSYVTECGPINPVLRIDAAIARAAALFFRPADRQSAMEVLMPWPKQPEREATVEDFMAILGNAKVKKD